LCEQLLEEGFDVTGLDTDFFAGCDFAPLVKVRSIHKDVRHLSVSDLEGFDAVIHLAALSNDPIGALNPELTRQINFQASVATAKLAKAAGVERFVFSSSCSVYGVAGDEMIDESGALNPATEYARSKVDSEKEIAGLASDGFSPVFLRNSTVYGVSPRLRVDLVVNNLAGWAFTTGKLRVMSDGSPWRPLIMCATFHGRSSPALKAPKDSVHGQTFNIGSNDQNYRVRDIIDAIKEAMPSCAVEYTGEPRADQVLTARGFRGKPAVYWCGFFKPQWAYPQRHKG
jgi:nucleoside-diphosphate-sugar epimerase